MRALIASLLLLSLPASAGGNWLGPGIVPFGGGGSGLDTAAGDARYLMLDASNDPVTGELTLGSVDLSCAVDGACNIGASGVEFGTIWVDTLDSSSGSVILGGSATVFEPTTTSTHWIGTTSKHWDRVFAEHYKVQELAAPVAPNDANYGFIWADSADSLPYWRDDSGVDHALASSGLDHDSFVVINESGTASYGLRVEGDTEPELICTDGTNDTLIIGDCEAPWATMDFAVVDEGASAVVYVDRAAIGTAGIIYEDDNLATGTVASPAATDGNQSVNYRMRGHSTTGWFNAYHKQVKPIAASGYSAGDYRTSVEWFTPYATTTTNYSRMLFGSTGVIFNDDKQPWEFRVYYNGSATPAINVPQTGGNYVGIHTATPGHPLDVVGNSEFTGDILPGTADTYDLGASANEFAQIWVDTIDDADEDITIAVAELNVGNGTASRIDTNGNNDLILRSNGVSRLFINNIEVRTNVDVNPTTGSTTDLGQSTEEWAELWVNAIDDSDGQIDVNANLRMFGSAPNIYFHDSDDAREGSVWFGAGHLHVEAETAYDVISENNLRPDGNGTRQLGESAFSWDTLWTEKIDDGSGVVSMEADLTPGTGDTHDLGASTLEYAQLWVNTIDDGDGTVSVEAILEVGGGNDLTFPDLDTGDGSDIIMQSGNGVIRGDLATDSPIEGIYAQGVYTDAAASEGISLRQDGVTCNSSASGALKYKVDADSSSLCLCMRDGASSFTWTQLHTAGSTPPSC